MTTAKEVLKMIKDNDVKYADFRFTDPRGKWQHVTFDIGMIEEETFAEGQMFDGSSIAGWKAINESDMCLMPDPASATHRSVLRRDHAGAGVRRARADHRRALQPRSARHRQEGRGHGEVDGRRRHRLLRPRGRVLRVRRREIRGQSLQYRLQARPGRAADAIPTPTTRAAISATASAPRRAISRCRRRTRCRTCAPRCSPPWPRWAARSRSITTRWPPPSTSSA